MLSELTRLKRRQLTRTEARLSPTTRYVDMGVELRVVKAWADGAVAVPGTQPVGLLRSHSFGGIYDTVMHCWTGEKSSNPVIWYCSEDQEPLALHSGDLPPKILAYGAMGSGKTEILAMWLILRSFELAGTHHEGLATAPTIDRAALILQALIKRCPPEWYTWRAGDRLFQLRCGVTIRLATTTQRSAEAGSPIQGWNSAFHAGDEYQDQTKQFDNIQARGRTAPGGVFRQCCTATAKDSPAWRTARDKLRTAVLEDGTALWHIARMKGPGNPFVWPAFWEELLATCDERTIKRIVYAEDVGPELGTYPHWVRELQLKPVPLLGATDCTAEILRPYGANLNCLVGHDPGRLVDYSSILRAYRLPKTEQYVWWVVDGIKTDQSHPAEHIKALKRLLAKKWGAFKTDYAGRPLPDSPQPLVRIDPYGNSDSRTDRTVKTWFHEMGFDHATNAALSQRPGGYGRIPKDAGIKMVDRLLATGRLFVDCDDRRQPCAPKLVEAFEMEERDATTGEAEVKRAHREDLSHYGASVRYALWLIEKLPVDTDESYTIVRGKGHRRAWQ